MFQKLFLLLGAVVLAMGFLVVFFSGTWEGARIGLEILGAIWLIQTTYSVIIQNQEEERKKQVNDDEQRKT
ncbi:MAG: hypothetical protein Q8R12_05255 [bacterium]|nr:hypothetical protein [bacterium]